MQPGPANIIECPTCRGLAQVFTLLSGNTFGAVRWTDGYLFAPSLPTPPPITRCPHCQTFFWTADAAVIGQINRILPVGYAIVPEPRIEPWAWHRAPKLRELLAAEYLEALAAGLANTLQRERVLRTLAWWRHNDAFRNLAPRPRSTQLAPARSTGEPATPGQPVWVLSAAAAENLARLSCILDPTRDEDRLAKAEARRELGQFDQAEALLLPSFRTGLQPAAEFILDLTRRHICELRELPERATEAGAVQPDSLADDDE